MQQENYDAWLKEVRDALGAINMPLDEWQKVWMFDFAAEYRAGIPPKNVADKANRFWWRNRNLSLRQNCTKTQDCWLPRGHQGKCEPVA